MGQQKGGNKLRRTAKHKVKYAAQYHKTEHNKARRARKQAERKAAWDLRGGQKDVTSARTLRRQRPTKFHKEQPTPPPQPAT